jgi:hypothetical protein
MKLRTFFAAAVLAMASPSPLSAALATEEGAEALKRQVIEYFGPFLTDREIVTIEPEGDNYAVALDLEKAFELLKIPGAEFKMEPFVTLLTSLPDGGWKMQNSEYPSATLWLPTPKGEFGGQMDLKGYSAEGLYTPNLPEIMRSKTKIDAINIKMHFPDEGGNSLEADFLQAGTLIDATVTAAGPSVVNFAMTQKIDRAAEIVTVTPKAVKDAPVGPPVKVTYDFGALTSEAKIDALRARAIANLWTWLAGHVDAQKAKADKAELKPLLLAALPLWERFGGSVTMNNLSVDMPQGSAAIKSLTEVVAMSGFTPQGAGRFALKFDGVSAQSPLLPSWSAQLMPASLDVDLTFAVAGLDQIARAALEDMDFDAKPQMSKESEMKIVALFMGGSPRITLAPGHFSNPLIDLGYEGEASVTPHPPSGHFTLTADGLDKTLAFLRKNAAVMPAMGQAVPAVLFAKSLAKADSAGKLTWVIDFTGDNSISVNGQKFPLGK